jgi:hypothetical protein
MLVVSKERYLPVTINTIVLAKEGRYYYVHRDVYDQAVVLFDRYQTLDTLIHEINGSQISSDTVAWFFENAPKPINILAPFLTLVDGEIEKDMEVICGVLHAITAMINVRNFILKPIEIRKSVSFSLSIKEEYEMAWDRFFMSAIPYEQRHGFPKLTQQIVGTPPVEAENDFLNIKAIEATVLMGSTRSEKSAIKKLLE